MLGDLQHGGRIDDLAAHFLGGVVNGGQTRAEGVGAIHDAAVHAALGNLSGNFLHVGAVGEHALLGQFSLVQLIIGQDLLGVLTHRHIAIAHRQQHVARLEALGQRIEALHVLGVPLRHAQGHAVLQQVYAGFFIDEIQTGSVDGGISGNIQLVHLLLTGGDKQVALGSFLDLGLECTRGIKVKRQGYVGRNLRVQIGNLGQGFGHRGGSKHNQLYLFIGQGGGAATQQHQRYQQGYDLLHGSFSFAFRKCIQNAVCSSIGKRIGLSEARCLFDYTPLPKPQLGKWHSGQFRHRPPLPRPASCPAATGSPASR